MVSVGVSKLGYTNLIFVDPGLKVNRAYYHNSCCLPYVRSLAFLISEFLVVQQERCLSAQGARDVQAPSARDSCIHLARFVVA